MLLKGETSILKCINCKFIFLTTKKYEPKQYVQVLKPPK